MPNADVVLDLKHLQKYYPIQRGMFKKTVGHIKAVDDVTLFVRRGETLGLVGESGCGKTTLGRVLAGLHPPSAGEVRLEGRTLFAPGRPTALPPDLRRRIQMVFQDPLASLNPRLLVGDLLTEGLAAHHLLGGESRADAAVRLLAEVGLDAAAGGKYPFELSGGQRQRVCIARALALRPDLVVGDEVVSALDVSVQAQVINLLVELRARHGLAYLMIGHDLSVLRHVSHRIAVMYLGRLAEIGPAESLVAAPKHPYAQALVAAVPVPGVAKKRTVLAGEPPSAATPPPGCAFHPRCPRALPICRCEIPAPRTVDGHQVWCHLY